MQKKVISLFMVMIMGCSLFAGCGNGKADESAANTDGTENVGNAGETGDAGENGDVGETGDYFLKFRIVDISLLQWKEHGHLGHIMTRKVSLWALMLRLLQQWQKS